MKHCYIDYRTRAIADVSCRNDWNDADPNEYYIHRINVPDGSRGLGHGSKILKQICDDADREGAVLILDVVASGPLGFDELVAWYSRYGFDHQDISLPGWMIRRPQVDLTSGVSNMTLRSVL